MIFSTFFRVISIAARKMHTYPRESGFENDFGICYHVAAAETPSRRGLTTRLRRSRQVSAIRFLSAKTFAKRAAIVYFSAHENQLNRVNNSYLRGINLAIRPNTQGSP